MAGRSSSAPPTSSASLDRRGAARLIAAGLAGIAIPGLARGAAGRRALPLIKPPRVPEGALVGLVTPGGAMTPEELERAVRSIESMGLRVKLGANVRLRRGNYAGTTYQQVQDFHEAFLDREVKAVWTGRGGAGCSLMLPLLDYRLIRAHAKVFIGLSDATALHLAIHRHARIVTFHGPAGVSTFSPYSVSHLRAAFMEPRPVYTITIAEEIRRMGETDPTYAERTITPGVATGPLVGGNLSVLTALVGTPYAAQFGGAIAFFEDINEAPYRVNRMLTHLAQGSDLPRAAGVMWGICRRCIDTDAHSVPLAETLDDRLQPLRIPAAYGMSFGHVPQHFTIPMGVRARFDATARTLTVLEPAVT